MGLGPVTKGLSTMSYPVTIPIQIYYAEDPVLLLDARTCTSIGKLYKHVRYSQRNMNSDRHNLHYIRVLGMSGMAVWWQGSHHGSCF